MASRTNRKKGGKVPMVASGNPNVISEAEDKSDRKKGGKVKAKMDMGGKKAKGRHDRPGRKAGGAVGANRTPLSTAHGVTKAP